MTQELDPNQCIHGRGGAGGHSSTGAESLGRRITAGSPNDWRGRQKIPKISQLLSSIQYETPQLGTWWRQTCFLPQAPSNLITLLIHGRPQKFFQGWQRRNFAYPFQVADDAMQMDVHKTLYPFCPISLRWLNLNSQSFVWTVFCTSAIRNAFSFHKLPNIHFWALSTIKS